MQFLFVSKQISLKYDFNNIHVLFWIFTGKQLQMSNTENGPSLYVVIAVLCISLVVNICTITWYEILIHMITDRTVITYVYKDYHNIKVILHKTDLSLSFKLEIWISLKINQVLLNVTFCTIEEIKNPNKHQYQLHVYVNAASPKKYYYMY